MKDYQNYLFDLYGTLVDVHTDEQSPLLWKRLSIFLSGEGRTISPEALKRKYFSEVQEREKAAVQTYGAGAEIDIGPVFAAMMEDCGITHAAEDVAHLAKLFRLLSTEKLHLFPGVLELLRSLKQNQKGVYLLSNAQALFTLPELHSLGIAGFFDGIVISSLEGFKKPDARFYRRALQRYELSVDHTVMIGNDDRADCWGAAKVGLDSMYICTEQSPVCDSPLPENCRILNEIGNVFDFSVSNPVIQG